MTLLEVLSMHGIKCSDVSGGPGWSGILDKFILDLNAIGWKGGIRRIVVRSASLHIYINAGGAPYGIVRGLTDKVERRSCETCEDCGAPGFVRQHLGGYRVLCGDCVARHIESDFASSTMHILHATERRRLYTCAYCGAARFEYPCLVRGSLFFCNHKCRSEHQRASFLGENNPNYGKRWSVERRKQQSMVTKLRMTDPDMRNKAGNANRGKKLSAELIRKMHANRTRESYIRTFDNTTLIRIGTASAAKWTPEYRQKHRATMELLGHWVPQESLPDRELYFKESNWVTKMFDLVSLEDKAKLAQLGVWNVKTNKGGLVRDHKFSRRSGFELGVSPVLLRHPVNCQLLTHGENVSKAQTNNRDRDDLSIDGLLDAIINYEGDWCEQEECITAIQGFCSEQQQAGA